MKQSGIIECKKCGEWVCYEDETFVNGLNKDIMEIFKERAHNGHSFFNQKRSEEFMTEEDLNKKQNCDTSFFSAERKSNKGGGEHYNNLQIQPYEYCEKNCLDFLESSIIKCASLHRFRNGRKDIEKIIHFAEFILESEYGDNVWR